MSCEVDDALGGFQRETARSNHHDHWSACRAACWFQRDPAACPEDVRCKNRPDCRYGARSVLANKGMQRSLQLGLIARLPLQHFRFFHTCKHLQDKFTFIGETEGKLMFRNIKTNDRKASFAVVY
jgi:hypothetical protein